MPPMQTPAARNSSLGRGSGPAASAASTILPKTTRTTSATPTTANLYQRCLDLEAELRTEQRVPGFSRYLDRAEESTRQSRTATTFTPSARPDPVTLLWTCLRMGGSLCHLVNVIRPGSIAESAVNEGINASGAPSSANQAKASVYYFLLACRNTLHVDDADLFAIGDLYRDDTNGFIRVLHTVELLLDRIPKSTISAAAQQPSHDSTGSGTLHREQSVAMSTRSRSRSPDKKIRHDSTSQRVPVTSGSPQATSATPRRSIRHSMDAKTHREKVLMEMVETERKYVADLERMQTFANAAKNKRLIPEEDVHTIFGDIDVIVDFQRKLLVGLEDLALAERKDQRIGRLFLQCESGFAVYGAFCAAQQLSSETALRHMDALKPLAHILEPQTELPSFLIKPVQRLCRYPLLIRELIKYTGDDEDERRRKELDQAYEAMNRVASMVNELRRREENMQIKASLEQNVENWKGFNLQNFGDLLLDKNLIMVRRDVEKSVHMFLFERILICCKELGPKTDKKKSSIGFSRNSRKSTVSALSGAGGTIGRVQNTQFALKGGVTINEIEGIVCTSSSLELKIFYKDYDSGDLESFVLRFLNEEYLNLWQTTVERLLEKFRRRSTNSANNKTPMTPVAPKRSERSRLTLTVDTVAGGRESLTPSRTSRPIVTPVSPIKKRGQRHGGMSPPSAAADAPDVPRTRIVSTDNRLSMKRVASEEVLPKTAGEYVGSTPAVTKRETPPALEVMMRVRKEDSSAALVGATSDRDESLQASSAAGSSDMLGNLAQALRDLDVAIQDEFQGMSPAAMESDAPVIPRPISVHISSKDGTGSPVPIVKVKAHHNDDIYVLFLAANIAHRELLTRVREKICDAHGDSELAASVTKMRYHDEDGDFITMGGDDDVRVAMRLALAGGVQTGDSAGRRRVVNLYVS